MPLGLIEVLDELVQEPLLEFSGDELDAVTIVEIVAAGAVHAAAALVGEVFYAGVVTAVIVAAREGRDHSLRHIARELPYLRLVGADLLLALIVIAGLIALIVPGLLFLAWFALIAPAVETERRGVIASFRRSRSLVRGNTGRVLALILPIILIEDLFASVIQTETILAIGDTFLGDWLAAVVASLATAPFYALAVVVIYLELRRPD